MSPRNGKLFAGSIAVAVVGVVLIAPSCVGRIFRSELHRHAVGGVCDHGRLGGGDAGVLQAQAAGIQLTRGHTHDGHRTTRKLSERSAPVEMWPTTDRDSLAGRNDQRTNEHGCWNNKPQ